ncbi:MAG: hypothetical protein SAJ37_17645 [Oscillatoria sp. PMC 1068.18]|nr:hypothetical protein [Oscillatoria sp. PMC 1076.18]MEC4990558.1 hypothetical protein [Oscillatoria sp. PMC 1068.18]
MISKKTQLSARKIGIIGSLAVFLTATVKAEALTLIRNYTGGTAPNNSVGEGNIIDIFNAAADLWEEAILDDYTLVLNYSWNSHNDDRLATYTRNSLENTFPSRSTVGTIEFNNQETINWFLDATPYQSEEYLNFTANSENLGAGEINTGRIYENGIGDAALGYDLFTVALQEIGHSLNIFNYNLNFQFETILDKDIDIKSFSNWLGTEIPITPINGGGYIDISTAVMYPEITINQRKLLSEVDILASAEISQFENINLNPVIFSPPKQPLIINGSFETGQFTGWETLGNTSIQTTGFGTGLTAGNFQALLSTEYPTYPDANIETFLGLASGSLDSLNFVNTTGGSAIKQKFTAKAGDILTFNWNFLTNEITPSLYNDLAFVSLNSASALADTTFAEFFDSLTPFREETGFQRFEYVIPTSGEYILGLGILDGRDTVVDSGLLIDNIQLSRVSVPEPMGKLALLSFVVLGTGSIVKNKQKSKNEV